MIRPGRRPGAVAAVLVAVIGLSSLPGCGLFGQDDPTVSGTRPARPDPTVTLLDPGSAPRRTVALDLRAGDTTDLVFAVDLHLTQRSADAEQPQVIDPPVSTQTVRFTVERVDRRGAVVAFEVVEAGIDPDGSLLTDGQILELTAAIQAVVGLSGRMEMDPQGRVRSVRYDDASAALPGDVADTVAALEQSITAVVPALPSEPIGRGARWRSVARTGAAGLTLRQTIDYEVTALEADHFLYRATVAQDAPEQDLGPSERGTTTRLLAADVTGTTTGRVSLSSLDAESETSLRGSQVVERSGGSSPPERVSQDLDIVVTIGPVGATDGATDGAGTDPTGP